MDSILKNLMHMNIILFVMIIFSNLCHSENFQNKNSFLSANSIEYHDKISLISAMGDVEIINGSDILRADKITYDISNDKILALGNVSLTDKDNNIYFSNKMELQGDLKKGVIKNFSSLLSDGSRLSANLIIRDSNKGDRLEKITFTRCEPCEDKKKESPIWQLRALKSERNIEDDIIAYKNVILDAYGIPILYIPYISHADPTIKKKSGLLSPKFNSNTVFGLSYSQPYYFALTKNKDLTLTSTMTSNEGPIIETNYRELRAKGSSFINTSITRGSHTNIDGKESNKIRGHIEIKLAERTNKNWVIGANAIRASDFSYIGRYKIKNVSEKNLSQKAYMSGRYNNFYTDIEAYYFQPLDAFKSNRHVPLIFPQAEMIWNKRNKNGINRKIKLQSSIIAKADASNMQKLSIENQWQKNNIFDSGHILNTNLSLRGDFYRNKRTDNSKTIGKKGTHEVIRAIPKINLLWKFPMQGHITNRILFIEPIIQTIFMPKGGNPDTIHNLDSVDLEISDANLFSSNRFAGLDKIEEGSRINFGLKTELIFKKYGNIKTLIGRSYSPLQPQAEKIQGTGLNKKLSNIVGNIIYDYNNIVNLSYKFRKKSWISQRDSVSMNISANPISTYLSYTMIKDDPVPTQNLISEQLHVGLNWNITNEWSTNVSQRRDLKDSTFGNAIYSNSSISYKNECIIISLTAQRKHENLIDIPDTTEYSLNFNLIGF